MRDYEKRLRVMESWMQESGYDIRHQIKSELYRRYRLDFQTESTPHLFSAICVNTIDPMAEGQVQFYTPYLTQPGTSISNLPWAAPISPFGGFDDCGVTWVPPAGSKLALFCENGDRSNIYYVGTFWTQTRGMAAGTPTSNSQSQVSASQLPTSSTLNRNDLWGMAVPEYDCVWEGTRTGYNLGDNQGMQVKQPWNTDNYNTKDWDSTGDFTLDPNARKLITYPHQYGVKSPEKHYWKFVDGDHKCNHRWRRAEMATGCGITTMMKDDHLHPGGQWMFNQPIPDFPDNDNSFNTGPDYSDNNGPDLSSCSMSSASNQAATNAASAIGGGSTSAASAIASFFSPQDLTQCSTSTEHINCGDSIDDSVFANPFQKRSEEMRFYQPVQSLKKYHTLMGVNQHVDDPRTVTLKDQQIGYTNVCDLPQSGWQTRTLSGMTFVMDDSVDQPQGEPRWNRDFDWGCNDVFQGRMYMLTTTGHAIELNDEEDDTWVRGIDNGIRIQTALGNRLQMHDHTLGSKNAPGNAGNLRGIILQSTSDHILEFHDEGNKQTYQPRQQGGEPRALADQAYVLLRSGYGLQLRMQDAYSQEETDQQYVQLLAPQKDNHRGPHQLVLQERTDDSPGLVMLRSGGVYYNNCYTASIEVVGDDGGDEEAQSADKFVQVTGKYLVDVDDYYFNHNNFTIIQSETFMLLFAGRDCNTASDVSNVTQAAQTANQNIQTAEESARQGIPNQLPLDKSPCLGPLVLGVDPYVCPYTKFVHFGVMSDPDDPAKMKHNSLSYRVMASGGGNPDDLAAEIQKLNDIKKEVEDLKKQAAELKKEENELSGVTQ